MAEYDNSGALFKNDKGDNDKRPDYRGDVTINGVKYALAGWVKQGAKGPFLALRVSQFQERTQQAARPAPQPRPAAKPAPAPVFSADPNMPDGDEIPF